MENLQSGEKAYQRIDEMNAVVEKQAKQLAEAQDKLKDIEEMNKRSSVEIELDATKKALENMKAQLKEYETLNQKLFLQLGVQVNEKPEDILKSQEESALDKRTKELQEQLNKTRDAEIQAALTKQKENNRQWL